MALGNWATAAVNEKGEPIEGTFVSPLGVEVEIYKDSLHVHDERAWREDGGFMSPVVMVVRQGSVRYQDVHIEAVRGHEDCIVSAVWSGSGDDAKVMLGIGCYGFGERGEWLGVTPAHVGSLREFLSRGYMVDLGEAGIEPWFSHDHEEWVRNVPLNRMEQFSQGDAFFAGHLGVPLPVQKVKL